MLVEVYYRWRPSLRDEGDNHLVELAVASAADAIVTNNLRDFQSPELKFDRVSIITPEKMLAELQMNAVTFQITDELFEKMKSVAESRQQPH